MSERASARRRRAALPAALAALLLLVIAAGQDAPARWSGEQPLPEMTIVLPPAVVAQAPPEEPVEPVEEPVALDEPPADVVPLDDSDGAAGGGEAPPAVEPDEPAGGRGGEPEEPVEEEEDDAIRHVFLIVLAQTDLVTLADEAAAAADPATVVTPYLAGELIPQGALLAGYASAARGSLANGIALVSGQGPTQATLADCPTAEGAAPADVTPDEVGEHGQQLGDGCVYPFATGTVADQLVGAGLDWRAYLEDAGEAACPATPRNPFAFFHALLDTGACASRVAGLDRLDADLAQGPRAPALMYVVPGACSDGRPEPCAPGAPAGAAAADAFLEDVVPRILASEAWADGGLIVVTSDGPPPAGAAPAGTAFAPTTYPNAGDAPAAGAGRVGALLIADSVRPGVRSDAPANHFTLLRAMSDLFALEPLGYAAPAPTVNLLQSALSSRGR